VIRAYIRTSTGVQDIETQKHAITGYLKRRFKDYKDEDCVFYIDRGMSGKRVDRPALAEMLKELQKDEVIVVTELSRFTRTGIGDMVLTVDQIVKKIQAKLVSLDQGIDFSTPEGSLMVAIYGYLANKEWEATRERNLRMQAARKAAGVVFGRKCKMNEEQARTAASMFRRGFKTGQIEKTFKMSRQVIYNALKRYGLAVPKIRPDFKEQLTEEVL
jgi:DNA invertase Pin-like site-specific DNA recombinase